MVNFKLPSTTNKTISTSTSQTFHSWVLIFHLRRPMTFLSLNLHDTSGLAPRMNVSFGGPGDLLVSYSNRDKIVERLKSSFRKFGHYGDLIQQYEVFLSRMLNDILTLDQLWLPIRLSTNRVRLANRGRLLLRTHGPVPFGTCICSNVETILSWTCHAYGPFEFQTSLGTCIFLHNTELDLHRIMSVFHGAFATGVAIQQERLPFRTPACASIVETRFLELAMSLLDFWPRIPLCAFSVLLLTNIKRDINHLKSDLINNMRKRKRSDSVLWQETPTPTTETSKKQRDNMKTPPKTLITQLLQTDLGRSVGVTAVTQLVWLNRFMSPQPSH